MGGKEGLVKGGGRGVGGGKRVVRKGCKVVDGGEREKGVYWEGREFRKVRGVKEEERGGEVVDLVEGGEIVVEVVDVGEEYGLGLVEGVVNEMGVYGVGLGGGMLGGVLKELGRWRKKDKEGIYESGGGIGREDLEVWKMENDG